MTLPKLFIVSISSSVKADLSIENLAMFVKNSDRAELFLQNIFLMNEAVLFFLSKALFCVIILKTNTNLYKNFSKVQRGADDV